MSADSIAIPGFAHPSPHVGEPLKVTLGELIAVLSELTEDENEIVITAVHMVSRGRVRLVEERVARPAETGLRPRTDESSRKE